MKSIMVAPVGENMEEIFIGIREFPVERVVLISTLENIDKANKAKQDLERFKIHAEIKQIKGNIWEETFQAVSEIKALEKEREVIVHTTTGDRNTQCAATSAAFVNGLKAIAVDSDVAMLLPILKFSYYKLLTNKKLEILKLLFDNKDCCASLDELSKKTKMSLPLISYHINGNLKSEGLKDLGLVVTKENKGRMKIDLSMLGRMLIKGYITSDEN
jgi:DNA-binding transcriptional ArsR family regulator